MLQKRFVILVWWLKIRDDGWWKMGEMVFSGKWKGKIVSRKGWGKVRNDEGIKELESGAATTMG